MSDITLSSATSSNLLSLQSTTNLIGRTQERLATGLKVDSAIDDALWDDTFAINLKGSLLAIQAVLPSMRQQKRGAQRSRRCEAPPQARKPFHASSLERAPKPRSSLSFFAEHSH